ncbi:Iroquois-class homeodomain protein IRX-2 [Sciurus carolinensis]|uniref:Iroquois-class homeodomain protein IRX-2 n=1 Tax=Sciurus carolinensis TaxID=30640 RepID=A0AA41MYA2_SCICA|nr:Iroquois-class homeodomain protein IRX-2 [Sciurus carolinensis]
MEGAARAARSSATRAVRPAPTVSYAEGYLYQATRSLALYSCSAAHSASAWPGLAVSTTYTYQLKDPAYRKHSTQDATATLKVWLNADRKKLYPTKEEKIMLATITKSTLTLVSTWFANTRRRLKRKNKMTWVPRRMRKTKKECEQDLAPPKSVTLSLLTRVEVPLLSFSPEATPRGGGANQTPLGSETSPGTQLPTSKPKLSSLAEIATSDFKQQSLDPVCGPQGLPAAAAPTSFQAPPGCLPYLTSLLVSSHLYYTTPFYGTYTNYRNLNVALQGQGLPRYHAVAKAPRRGSASSA